MNRNHFFVKSQWCAVGLIVIALFVISCNECKTSADCPTGKICISGECNSSENSFDTGTDADADSDSDSDADSDAGTEDSGMACISDVECDDGVWCNGLETCSDQMCRDGLAPCSDNTDTPCKNENVCNEEKDLCSWTPTNEGDTCSTAQFCLGGDTKICKGGLCQDPSSFTGPCESTECLRSICDEALEECIDSSSNETDSCYEENFCEEGTCQEGLCVDKIEPCELLQPANPCLLPSCVPVDDPSTGKPYTCEFLPEENDIPCDSPFVCQGTNAYCYADVPGMPTCWHGETRPCHDSPYDINTAESCQNSDGPDPFNCTAISPPPTPIALSLGLNDLPMLQDHFLTREYYEYGSSCTGLDYRGMEAVLQLPSTCVGKSTTLTVSTTEDKNDIVVLHLTDYQDPTTCQSQGTNTLAIAAPTATDQIILEAPPGYPKDFDLNVSCP